MGLAFLTAFAVFRYNTRGRASSDGALFPIILAAVFGGILGAKLPLVLLHLRTGFSWPSLLVGRTIVGGLIGGTLGVLFIKKRLGIRGRYGNELAAPIALGMAVGRVGCLLSGCCFGTPTSLPWGMDFGDGIARHPTQLYELVFCLAAFFALQHARKSAPPGRLLTQFFAAYFVFRFIEEWIRPHLLFAGLTAFQWICIAGLLILSLKSIWMKTQEARP
jgi:prolipoprotein diacylglyceryltransferase